ncbi:hypothetical protein F5141DRAFT_1064235 [Pisolithus sp. B1]|nr:hypothetical protein F5141DRAFT_1064235 [Pisolithus sp. B1]
MKNHVFEDQVHRYHDSRSAGDPLEGGSLVLCAVNEKVFVFEFFKSIYRDGVLLQHQLGFYTRRLNVVCAGTSLQANLWALGGSTNKYGCLGGAGNDANGGRETSSYSHPQSTSSTCGAPAMLQFRTDHGPTSKIAAALLHASSAPVMTAYKNKVSSCSEIVTRYGEMDGGNEVLSARDLLRAMRTQWSRFIDALGPIPSAQYRKLSLVVKVEEREEYKLTSRNSTIHPGRCIDYEPVKIILLCFLRLKEWLKKW